MKTVKTKYYDQIFGGLLVFLMGFCIIDAFASALWVNHHYAGEANPLMAALMDVDLSLFMYVKLGVTFLSGIILWKIRQYPLAKYALAVCLITYGYIFYKHACIAYEVICFHNAIGEITSGHW